MQMDSLTRRDRKNDRFFQQESAPDEAALSAAIIARGRALAADSSYPPFEICREIAASIVGSDSELFGGRRPSPSRNKADRNS
jgi:hypothetical protein